MSPRRRWLSARMVHVSSIDVFGNCSPTVPADESTIHNGELVCSYVSTKRAAEKIVLDYVAQGLNALIVNPGFMLGPWDWKPSSGRVLLKVATGWALLAPPGSNSYCDVRDVAGAILAALEHGRTGERYILAGQSLSYREALNIFARITGVRPALRTAIRPTINLIGNLGDIWGRVTGNETDVNSAATTMSMWCKHYSIAKAAAELGYQTRGLEESATDAWSWFKQHRYVKSK